MAALALAFFLLLPFYSCSSGVSGESEILTVHFLDVGQADASFVEFGSGLCMLIDTADEEHSGKVCSYIKSLGYTKIDTLLLSHPHADHTGGATSVIEEFRVGRILIPECDYTTPEADEALLLAENQGIEVCTVGLGDSFILGKAEVELLSQYKSYEDENDYSAVARVSYKNRAFLFMGDATSEAEMSLLESGACLRCDAVKVGHHGSNSSSSEEFIKATGALYAVISCSADNEYSHPSPYAVQRWRESSASVIATDECSDTVFKTDGEELWVSVKRENILSGNKKDAESNGYMWVLDTENKVVHESDCRYVNNIEKENAQGTNASLDRILAEGYIRCSKEN